MKISSLDPRIERAGLPAEADTSVAVTIPNEYWETWEVFHQKKRGQQHGHVGIVHAPDSDMALVFAKEQYGRRGETVNLWVVRTSDVYATDYADSDAFATAPEKTYRDPAGYKTADRIAAWKAKQEASNLQSEAANS